MSDMLRNVKPSQQPSNEHDLRQLCRKQALTIQSLQLEIRERCQSYLIHSNKKGQSKPSEIPAVLVSHTQSFASQLKDSRKLTIDSGTTEVQVNPSLNKPSVIPNSPTIDQFSQSVIAALKERLQESQQAKTQLQQLNATQAQQLKQLQAKQTRTQAQMSKLTQTLLTLQQFVTKTSSELPISTPEDIGESVLNLLKQKTNKDQRLKQSSFEQYMDPDMKKSDFISKTPDRKLEKILPHTETTCTEFGESRQRPLAKSQHIKQHEALEPAYYVEEELPVFGDGEFVKRSFMRKKIVKRSISISRFHSHSKSSMPIGELLQNSMLRPEGSPNCIADNQRVSEVSRESDMSRMSGDMAMLDVRVDNGRQELRTVNWLLTSSKPQE